MRTIGLRTDYTAKAVRTAAARVCDAAQARRLLSIAAVYDGMNRRDAAKIGGMDRQTLRDWVHRFNAEGPEGVVNRKPPGAAPKLTPEQKRVLAALVEAGPDVETDGLIRWRRIDLKQVIRERFGVDYHERSVSRLLHDLGFSHVSARPQHPKQNAKAMDMFKKFCADAHGGGRASAHRHARSALVAGRDALGAEEWNGSPMGAHRHSAATAG